MVNSRVYYSSYFGHDVDLLDQVHEQLRSDPGSEGSARSCIFLAGDSSLDNKFWFADSAPALNGYERVLSPPIQKVDVCYWLNAEATRRRRSDIFCINTAVEATTLNDRAFCRLLPQDDFVRTHIGPDDYLIVSVGGNDLAMAPLLATIVNIIPLLCCTPQCCIERGFACPPNAHVDCGCCGCGLPGCVAAAACGCPPGLGYFVDLFGHRVENYVRRMLGGRRPRKVLVCMIYFLDMHSRGSWADPFLACMGYNVFPSRLQSAIRRVFELATKRISIPGVQVEGFPLFEVLDGTKPSDYVQRVEPSPSGGAKMAKALMDALLSHGEGCRRRVVAPALENSSASSTSDQASGRRQGDHAPQGQEVSR